MAFNKKSERSWDGLVLYVVPLKRSSTGIGPTSNECFVFFVLETVGDPFVTINENKTILLVGKPDLSKATFITNLFNYALGVDWNNPFRFVLKEDGQEEKDCVSVYQIH